MVASCFKEIHLKGLISWDLLTWSKHHWHEICWLYLFWQEKIVLILNSQASSNYFAHISSPVALNFHGNSTWDAFKPRSSFKYASVQRRNWEEVFVGSWEACGKANWWKISMTNIWERHASVNMYLCLSAHINDVCVCDIHLLLFTFICLQPSVQEKLSTWHIWYEKGFHSP